MRHIIYTQDLSTSDIETIFREATRLETEKDDSMKGKIMASLFYEPSTRTRFSFESAMLRLGGQVITTENAKEFSSAAKGETLEDSIKVINYYADVIVMRHYEMGASERAAAVSNIPIINAGDGPGQHPTQALLDLYTIQCELGRLDNLVVAFVGDLKNGRTIRSLSYLLGKYSNNKIIFVSPKELKVGEDIREYLTKHNVEYTEVEDLESVIGEAEVVYQTRIQKERFANPDDYQKHKGAYILTTKYVNVMQPHAIIMHPLPRVDEIAIEVDASPKAVYFKQAKYGVLVRMALLKLALT